MTTGTGMSTDFDGSSHLTTAIDAGMTLRTADGVLGLALASVLSAAGNGWGWECWAGRTAHASGAMTLDAAADFRLERLHATRDAEGRPVTSDTTAVLPSLGGRIGLETTPRREGDAAQVSAIR